LYQLKNDVKLKIKLKITSGKEMFSKDKKINFSKKDFLLSFLENEEDIIFELKINDGIETFFINLKPIFVNINDEYNAYELILNIFLKIVSNLIKELESEEEKHLKEEQETNLEAFKKLKIFKDI
jgi:hypothetical protein